MTIALFLLILTLLIYVGIGVYFVEHCKRLQEKEIEFMEMLKKMNKKEKQY